MIVLSAAHLLPFVPADRPERFAKAFAAGADAIVIDFEDAVAPDRKVMARAAVVAAADVIGDAQCPVVVRLNPHGGSDHRADFAADIGCADEREALLSARSELVMASRLTGRTPPIDGVTTEVRDVDRVRADSAYAAGLGFGGKLLIHPAQGVPAREGFRPSAAEIAWAERVLLAGGGAVAMDGAMVDAPVRLRAERIRQRAVPPAANEKNRGTR